MNIIDLTTMNLAKSNCTIDDFMSLLRLCESHKYKIKHRVVDNILFYFPEDDFFCEMENFPALSGDRYINCSPVICCASGNNYFLLQCFGDDFMLNQHASLTAVLINLSEYFNDVRILDARYDEDSSLYLIRFNGYTSN